MPEEEKPRVVELGGRIRLEFYEGERAIRAYRFWRDPIFDEERRGKMVVLYLEDIRESEECWSLLEEFLEKARPKTMAKNRRSRNPPRGGAGKKKNPRK